MHCPHAFQMLIQILIQILKRQVVLGRMAGMFVVGDWGEAGGIKLQSRFLARKI